MKYNNEFFHLLFYECYSYSLYPVQVVLFLPQTLVINRLGRSVSLCQCNTELVEWFHPNDPPKLLKWKSSARNELLKVGKYLVAYIFSFCISSSQLTVYVL